MRICVSPEILIVLLLSNLPWITDAHTPGFKSPVRTRERKELHGAKSSEKSLRGNGQRRPVTEEEISYIASTLQPRECLSLLYLLHHDYKRRRRRELTIEKRKNQNQPRSAQITPCETMLLNYWRDPRSRDQRDCSHVSRTLRQVKRQDLARWLWGRRPPCSARTFPSNGSNDPSSMTAQMQVIPIYSSRSTANRRTSAGSGTWDSIMWVYIALAVCATTTVLLCLHYLFTKLGKSSKYTTLADRDARNVQYPCACVDKFSYNKKKRYQPPPIQTGCGCSGN